MRQFFPTSLTMLLVMGSLGNVFAAAFCPRMLGHNCCLTRTASDAHSSQSHQHMQGMATDGMADESMSMNSSDMPGMTMEDADVSPAVASDQVSEASTSEEPALANKVESPIDACTHCLSHSGIQNAPVPSVSVPDQSNKDLGSVLSPVSRFLAQPAMTLAQIGLPREHAPPGSAAPRYILISVFLI